MQPEEPDNRNKKVVAVLAVLLVTVLVVVGVKAFKPKTSDAMNADGGANTPASTASTGTSAAAYKDGTYTADGDYRSPGGAESIKVQLTIKNNAVVGSSVTSEVATDDEAQEFQSDFIGGYKNLVVGKNVNDIRVSRVSGSSLTSEGFNNALEQIKNQAKA
jgi:uncharacterized protein with FMN-binding domain